MISLAQASEIVVQQSQVAAGVAQQIVEHAAQAEHTTAHGSPHIVNWVILLAHAIGDSSFFGQILIQGEKIIFTMVVMSLIAIFCFKISSRMNVVPTKIQVLLENMVIMLDDLVCGITGSRGRAYTPFVGALFIYILVSNFYGLVPLQNSATAYITTTAPLAVAVFFYVQWTSLKANGLWGYIKHLAGDPKDLMGYFLMLINFPLHILGEFTKPITLMFRLYGNMMAGHILVAVFLGMGVDALRPFGVPIGVPLHFPFLFLEVLVCLIQAFVFALLTAIYIGMMLPHESHSHEDSEHEYDLVVEHVHEPVHGENHAH
ncbi:ATP synthase subunit a [Gammaproteobacteria bacterium]